MPENWFDSTFWTHGVPNNSVDATVNNGGIAQIAQPTITTPPQVAMAATLTIGTSTTTGSTVELSIGNPAAPGLTVNNLIIGQNGTFAFDGGFATWGSFQNNGTVDFNSSGSFTGFSGSGQINILPGISVTFGGNTFSGTTNIGVRSALTIGTAGTVGSLGGNVVNNGTLTFFLSDTSSAVISGTGVVAQTGTGTTILTGNNTYTGGTTISAGTLQLGNGGTAGSIIGNVSDSGVLAFDRSDTVTFGGAISGTGSVTQIGTGTTILTGSNTYTGGTTISAGTLQLGNGGTAGSITGNVSDNGVLAFDRSDTVFFGGVISGTGSVIQIGTGTTFLTGTNTYSGSTTVSAGTLAAGSATALSPNSEFTVNSILDLNGFSNTIGSLSGTGIVLNNGETAATLTVGNDNASSTFGGVLQNGFSALLLIKSGIGTLTLTGDNFPTSTTISGGTLQIGNGGTTGSISGDIIDNGALAFNRSDSITVAGAISGTGSVTQIGAGTTILTGTNTYTGGTTISAGTLQVGNGGTTGSISGNVSDNGVLAFDRSDSVTFGGAISGTGSVTQIGTGTTILTGANTYSGSTTISVGTLQAGSATALSQNSEFTVNSILDLHGFNSTIASLSGTGTVLNNGATAATLAVGNDNASTTFSGVLQNGTSALQLTKLGTGTLTLTGANTYSGNTTISAGTLQLGNGGTTGSVTGNIINNGVLAFDRSDSATFAGVISGTGSVTQIGTGTTILSGANTYSGSTTISAGTLQAGSATALSQNSEFTVNSILDLHGFNSTIASLSGTGTVLNNGATTATLAVGNDNASTTFSGVLQNGTSALQLTKSGTGTLTLTGANTYGGPTTISAGTLQLGNGGTTGSISGDVIDSGVLTFDRSNSLTFAGAISGAGSVTQIGTGTTILTGTNTYAGGTTISAGTLQLGNGGTAGSITGNVSDNGVLAFDRSDSVTFAGTIGGTGSVAQIGTGATILTGSNTYAGGTTISAGTLQAGSATALSQNSEFTVNSVLDLHGFNSTIGSLTGTGTVLNNGATAATLTVGNDNASTTFSGALQDGTSTLQLTKSGTGTLTLTGNNTYTGGTTISAGTLQLGNGGTTGSVTGNVIDNGVLAFNRSDSVTFGGVISGGGSLVKQGAGTLTLPGANTYTGTTTVNAGSLIVDGSIASQQTFVNASAFLGGHGTIGGNLSNSGIVGPGDSPGTLTVANNYTQNTTGTLRIRVGGLAANQHDLLAVNGHVTLGGTLQLVRLGSFNLQPGNQIVFLTAQNGVSGAFNTVQNDFATGTIVKGVVTTSAGAVVLEGQQGSFTQIPGVTLTSNQNAVGKMLNSAVGDPRETALFAFLNSQPVANLPQDYNLIAPTQVSSVNATAVSVGRVQASNIGGRMANIRAGSTGFSSAGFAISGGAASFGEGFEGVSGPEGKSGPPALAPTPGNRWGVFLTGLGEFTNVDSTPNAPGYDVNTGGFTLGVDYRLTPNFALGLSAGYAHTNVGIDSSGGNIDVNAGKIGMYATVFGNGFYLDAAVSGGPSGYTTHRTALQGSANGSTNGGDLDGLVAGGYDWKKGNLTIGPTASFQYNYVALDGFTETGSLAPLKFPRQNTESERTAVGAKASYEWKIGNITAIPQFSAAWQHEFGSTTYSVVANLASGAGNSFTVFGPHIGRDSLLIGVGATVILNERVSTYLYYDGEFARTNYLSNNVSGGVRISF